MKISELSGLPALELFIRVNEFGARLHRMSWLTANEIAKDSLQIAGLNPEEPRVKAAAALITLRILEFSKKKGTL